MHWATPVLLCWGKCLKKYIISPFACRKADSMTGRHKKRRGEGLKWGGGKPSTSGNCWQLCGSSDHNPLCRDLQELQMLFQSSWSSSYGGLIKHPCSVKLSLLAVPPSLVLCIKCVCLRCWCWFFIPLQNGRSGCVFILYWHITQKWTFRSVGDRCWLLWGHTTWGYSSYQF